MKKIFKKRAIIIIAIIIIILIAAIYAYFKTTGAPSYNFIIAKKTNLIYEVSATGKVKPTESVDLAFEKSGRIISINASIGSKISAGMILAVLDNSELTAQITQAKAKLKIEKAKLEELRIGPKPEEIKINEIKIENAKISLEDAKRNALNQLNDAYTKSDDAVRNKTDQIFDNPKTSNPQLKFLTNDSSLDNYLRFERLVIEDLLKSWKLSLDQLIISNSFPSNIDLSRKNLNEIKTFLEKSALAVNSLTPSTGLTQATIDSWKSDISTARTNINSAINSVSSANEKLRTTEASLSLTEQELILTKSGSTNEQLIAQEARIEEAEANIKNIKAQISKAMLISPINGTITKKDPETGQIITAGQTIFSIISESRLEIESNIPETDIAKIKINNTAKITLDAYGNEIIFEAKVVAIEPAETIIEEVSTYKITLNFIGSDIRVKPGMTANIDILTAAKENVIAIPQRAIISAGEEKIIKILENGDIKDIKVKTGIKDSDGNIEIIEGIKEGDKIIL